MNFKLCLEEENGDVRANRFCIHNKPSYVLCKKGVFTLLNSFRERLMFSNSSGSSFVSMSVIGYVSNKSIISLTRMISALEQKGPGEILSWLVVWLSLGGFKSKQNLKTFYLKY